MSYMTGPAVGTGPAHTHKVPCCAPCAAGKPCATGDVGESVKSGLFLTAVIGIALLGFVMPLPWSKKK